MLGDVCVEGDGDTLSSRQELPLCCTQQVWIQTEIRGLVWVQIHARSCGPACYGSLRNSSFCLLPGACLVREVNGFSQQQQCAFWPLELCAHSSLGLPQFVPLSSFGKATQPQWLASAASPQWPLQTLALTDSLATTLSSLFTLEAKGHTGLPKPRSHCLSQLCFLCVSILHAKEQDTWVLRGLPCPLELVLDIWGIPQLQEAWNDIPSALKI